MTTPTEDGCPACKQKSKPADQAPKGMIAQQTEQKKKNQDPKKDEKEEKKKESKPKKKEKFNWCNIFTRTKDELGSQRNSLGVPPDTKISVDLKLADMDKLCNDSEKNPKLIIQRLQHYQKFLTLLLNLNADEQQLVAKTLRDS